MHGPKKKNKKKRKKLLDYYVQIWQ